MKKNSFYSKIDSDRFGFETARVNEFPNDVSIFIKNLKNDGIDLVISRIKAEDVELINKLLQNGFQVMDIGLVYSHGLHDVDSSKIGEISDEVLIRFFKEKDITQLEKLTAHAFENYGHYFADKKLNREKCRETYIDWIRNSCFNKDFGDTVLIAEVDGRIAGYLVVRLLIKEEKLVVDTGLGAVDPLFRGMGVFSKLIIHSMHWSKEKLAVEETVTVLATNYPVNKAYSKLSFVVKSSFITLHGWI